MTSPLKGEAKLQLKDGRSFTLVLDHEALFAAESLARKPLEQVLAELVGGFHGARRAVLFGALRRHHPDVTPEEATQIMVDAKMAAVEAITAALVASQPKAAEGDNAGNAGKPKAKKAGKRPTGTRSGRSGAKPG